GLLAGAAPPSDRRGGRPDRARRRSGGRAPVADLSRGARLPRAHRQRMTATAIDARGLGKDFGAIRALGGLDLEVRQAEFFELLVQFGLRERRRDPVRALSGGMRRALDIARGLLHEPRVLFLDEPTAGLDPRSRRSLWELIQRLRSASGLTVFLTTHYVEEAEPCDRVAVLDRGSLAALGTPAELKRAAGVSSLEAVFLARTGHPLAASSAA